MRANAIAHWRQFTDRVSQAGLTRPAALLWCLGGLSGVVWWVGLVRPYHVDAVGLRPLRDLFKLTQRDPGAQAAFVLTLAALSALYYLAWRVCRGRGTPALWRALVISLLVINGILLGLYPIGAADVFDNIVRGRLTAVHGRNPFYDPPRAVRTDPFFRFSAWPGATSAYGPAWEGLAAGVSRLAGDGVLANLLAFKLTGVAAYFGCAALLAWILRRRAPARALQGVCLFAWNPLVLYETAGNGHNDIVMVLAILAGLAALTERRPFLAALAFTAGALVKFIPVLLVPIALGAGMRWEPTPARRVGFLVRTGLACAALVTAAYVPFWRPGEWLTPLALERRAGLFTTSLPALIQAQLEPGLGEIESQRWVSSLAALATALAALAAGGWLYWRQPVDWEAPVRAAAAVLMFYLLAACLWFQAWYAIWPLALAALLPEGALARLIVLLSYSALWKTIIFNVWLYRGGPLPPRTWRETWLAPATLGFAWAYAAYLLMRAARRLRLALRPRMGP